MARILIAGCGYLGGALAARLASEGHRVWGLRRDASRLPEGVLAIAADLTRAGESIALPEALDFAVVCVAPTTGDEASYRPTYVDGLARLLDGFDALESPPGRVFFTSSTSVYAQSDGSWVDETSPTEPSGFRGQTQLAAEKLLGEARIPGTVLRLGGLYGPGRTRLLQRVQDTKDGKVASATIAAEPPHYTNRIHRDDAVAALHHLMFSLPAGQLPDSLYLGVDSFPASEAEVAAFLADLLDAPAPQPRSESEPAPIRRTGSKRCRNDRLLGTGLRFRYPSFREGYREMAAVWRAERERA